MMHSGQLAKVAASCGTLVLAALAVVWLAGFGSAGIENSGAVSIENDEASLIADVELAVQHQATDIGKAAITNGDVAMAPESMMGMAAANIAPSYEPESMVEAALRDL